MLSVPRAGSPSTAIVKPHVPAPRFKEPCDLRISGTRSESRVSGMPNPADPQKSPRIVTRGISPNLRASYASDSGLPVMVASVQGYEYIRQLAGLRRAA
jgi:hypothetical protein